MAKAEALGIAMEVAPPQFVSVARRKVGKMMDTIAEEERESFSASMKNVAAPSSFMRELRKEKSSSKPCPFHCRS